MWGMANKTHADPYLWVPYEGSARPAQVLGYSKRAELLGGGGVDGESSCIALAPILLQLSISCTITKSRLLQIYARCSNVLTFQVLRLAVLLAHGLSILKHGQFHPCSNHDTRAIKQILLVLLHNFKIVFVLKRLLKVLKRLVPKVRDAVVRECALSDARFVRRSCMILSCVSRLRIVRL